MTLRARLFAIAAVTALAFVGLITLSQVSAARIARRLTSIEREQLPRLELRSRLERRVEALTRAFQDAVAAKDTDMLADARRLEAALLDDLDASHALMEPRRAEPLRTAVLAWAAKTFDVSRRLIAGGGAGSEQLLDEVAEMQALQRDVARRLEVATAFDRDELSAAFLELSVAQAEVDRLRLVVSVVSMLLVLLLAGWVGRGLLQSVADVNVGLERFGTGDFSGRIVHRHDDELGAVARRANEMAENLEKVARERARATWLAAGHAGLALTLRGELTPERAASQALQFLVGYLDVPAGALYFRDAQGGLAHLASVGRAGPAPARLGPGDGLLGRAVQSGELTTVGGLPRGYFQLQSSLGEASPRALVLVPLASGPEARGVLELACLGPLGERERELLLQTRESLAIALDVAVSRAQAGELLVETRQQADRLAAQEEELRLTNERLEEQRTALEHSNQELASISTYKSRFLTNMSHELRTPLNSMLLLSDLLAENDGGNLTPRQVEYCNTIHAAGRDLLALINQVLDLARVESGKQEIRVARVPLADVLDRARRVFEPLAAEKGLEFSVRPDEGLPRELDTDRQRLDQILTNLLGNAIKFTERGSVTLRVTAAGGQLRFSVTDTGRGIAPQHRQRVFAPFEQVEAESDRRYGGSGLGLSIARELAVLLGGELTLDHTAPNQGSTFTLRVPL